MEKLKDEIRADRDVLIKVRDQVRGAKEQLNSQYKALKQAPAEDWNRIKTRYGLNSTGAGNITGLLFGETAKTWLERLLTWTTQAKRMLPGGDGETTPEPVKPTRGEGRFIRFPTANPLPDFLIRKALLT